jgi:hypothetical protein
VLVGAAQTSNRALRPRRRGHPRRVLAAVGVLCLTAVTGCGTTLPMTTSADGGGGGVDTGSGVDGSASGATNQAGTGSGSAGSSTGTFTSGGSSGSATGGGTTHLSGSTGSQSGGTSGGGTVPAGTANRTPIKVGVLTTDIGKAVTALGGTNTTSKKPEDAYKAVFRTMNATGGMAGRRIEATYQTIDATESNYQASGDRVCAAFKDAKAEVVLSQSASTDYGSAACLQAAGIPLITTVASDSKGLAGAPWVFDAFSPRFDRGYGAVVDQLAASGYLTPASRIGVVYITCAEVERAYKNSVRPRMKANKLGTPYEFTVSCASGFGDAGAYASSMQSAVLQFQSRNIDRVFVIGSQETLLLTYFARQAENQNYHPGYALSSASLPVILPTSSTYPTGQLKQLHGAGWSALSDAGVDPKLPAERRCVSLATKGGLAPSNISETYGLYTACTNMFLLETSLLRNGGHANGPALRAVIPTLGTSFASPGLINDSTFFGPGRPDGPQLAAEWAYVASCNCVKYVGKPKVMN